MRAKDKAEHFFQIGVRCANRNRRRKSLAPLHGGQPPDGRRDALARARGGEFPAAPQVKRTVSAAAVLRFWRLHRPPGRPRREGQRVHGVQVPAGQQWRWGLRDGSREVLRDIVRRCWQGSRGR